ncbi:MAG: glutathione S-transferase family protein [Lysobacterales bacterium]
MYTLYIGNKNYSSWSLRPWILMRALAIPFEERVEFFLEGSCWDKFRAFSPNGLVPCLHDGDRVIWESLGIVEYLAERHDGVWPQDTETRAWARCATSEMHAGFSALRNECPMNCGLRVELNSISPALQQNLDRLDELWSEGLNRFGGSYLAGETFTAVDAFYAPVAFRVQTFNLKLGATAMAYVQRMLKLEWMNDWYESGLAETWRETEHDREAYGAGNLIADLRTPVPG